MTLDAEHQIEMGQTGQYVHPIGYGAMALSYPGRPETKESLSLLEGLIRKGPIYVDSANVYCQHENELGHNERLIANLLSRSPELAQNIYIGTKGGLTLRDKTFHIDASPKQLRSSCEQSLKNLNQESIFMYFLHTFDDQVPIEDSVYELSQLQKEGKIQHIGLSNVSIHHLKRILPICRIEAVQNKLNLYKKDDLFNGVIDLCERHQITYMPYSPLGGKKYGGVQKLIKLQDIPKIADFHHASVFQVILSWLISQSASILPIPSSRIYEKVIENLNASYLSLDEDQISDLNDIPDNFEFKGWMTKRIDQSLFDSSQSQFKETLVRGT